mmetsp:Transcript_42841/g.132340  ORF Transcript_42841/g.132340 Transcript_42841/m.132340 type:complete len:200 (-) Transcript_42841:107-706(-)
MAARRLLLRRGRRRLRRGRALLRRLGRGRARVGGLGCCCCTARRDTRRNGAVRSRVGGRHSGLAEVRRGGRDGSDSDGVQRVVLGQRHVLREVGADSALLDGVLDVSDTHRRRLELPQALRRRARQREGDGGHGVRGAAAPAAAAPRGGEVLGALHVHLPLRVALEAAVGGLRRIGVVRAQLQPQEHHLVGAGAERLAA